MKILIRTDADATVIVELSGDIDLYAAGDVLNALVGSAQTAKRKLVVDLSGVQRITRAALRGFVVAAKLLQSQRGDMRICGANPSVEASLRGLGMDHLLKFDASRARSIAALSGVSARRANPRAALSPGVKTRNTPQQWAAVDVAEELNRYRSA
ncbi:MAG: STAS domain-containing protein [Sulfitobacter sp.]